MTAIDWKVTQKRLGARVDGNPGRETYGKLFGLVASSKARASDLERLAQSAAKYCAIKGATTAERLAEVVAQCANETGGFTKWEENLNYSDIGLAQTWGGRYATNPDAPKSKRIPNAKAKALAHRPEAIANDSYGARMGNLDSAHDTDSHPDGWQYRGRGALQLTGRAAYALYSQLLELDLINRPDLASDPFTSFEIALEFCRRNKVWAAVDAGDYLRARKITNGGDIALDHVATLRGQLLKVLKP